jgi:hypothetical protein
MRFPLSVLSVLAFATFAMIAGAQAQPWIDLPAQRASTYNSSSTRGFQCTAPFDFRVVAVRVPDPNSQGFQSVAVFRMAAKAPAFSASTILAPDFRAIVQPSAKIIPVIPPVHVLGSVGEWLGVLGACSTGAGATMNNPYAASSGIFTGGRLGGQATTLYRFLTQSNLSTLAPSGTVTCSSEDVGNVSLVEVYAIAHGASNVTPAPGQSVTLTCESGREAGTPGSPYICALSFGEGPISLPSGPLPLSPDALFFLTVLDRIRPVFQNGFGTLDANGEGAVTVNIPNAPVLKGISFYSAFITNTKVPTVSRNVKITIS